jgi:PAS domain S-box-containing protein
MESKGQSDDKDSPIAYLRRVSLDYGSLRALNQVDFRVHSHEIHALVGEHGAGKSSLCSVLGGGARPTEGHVSLFGLRMRFVPISRARELGIQLVTQQPTLFDNLTVADNLFVDKRRITRKRLYASSETRRSAAKYLSARGFDLDPTLPMHRLNLSERTVVDILRHTLVRPQLLILDEALDKLKTEDLHRIVSMLKELKDRGTSILFVTHRIDDIYHLADRVTIFRDGRVFISDAVEHIHKTNLIKLAYTQAEEAGLSSVTREEFYELLRYNEAILRNLPINLLVVDLDRRVKLVNEQAKELFRLPDKTYFNLPLSALIDNGDRRVRTIVEQALEETTASTFYDVPFTPPGGPVRANVTVRPIFDGTFPIGHMVIIEDITEREELREQMVLSERLASVGILAAGVAHEINSPLETIHNFVEYLKSRHDPSRDSEVIDFIEEEVSSISAIVSNLSNFSTERGVPTSTFDANELIDNMLSLVRYDASHRHIDITFQPTGGQVRLHAHPNEIKQVLLNLLKNSYDAMPKGGRITIATSIEERDGVEHAVIEFTDTGPGIRGSEGKDIFLPFYSTKVGDGHLGLGLSVSYGIVTKYAGHMDVESPADGGSKFTLRFPAVREIALGASQNKGND